MSQQSGSECISRIGCGSLFPLQSTGGGSRTHTGVSAQRILSPQRLPFRHAGSCGEVSTGRRCHKRKKPGRPGRFAIGAGPIRSRSDRSGGTPIHDPARTSPPLPRHSSPATNLLGRSKACNRSTRLGARVIPAASSPVPRGCRHCTPIPGPAGRGGTQPPITALRDQVP